MTQRKVLLVDSGHQAFDELDATDIPTLAAYDAAGAAAAAQAASQPLNANLTAVGGLTSAANKGIQYTGSGTAATYDLTAAAKTVLDDTTVGAMVDTLGGASSTGTGGLVRATSPTFVTPVLGTPTSGVATNLTGTAAGLTAGNVTTNANLTGDVTSVGNATTLATVTVAKGGTNAITAAAARTNLGLVLGTDVAVPARLGRSVHGGTTDFSFPGSVQTGVTSTFGPVINTAYYNFMWTPTAITIDQLVCYVSTAPASTSNIRLGIYVAGGDLQPSGAALFDQTTTVANNFTGAKALSQTVVIPAGPFLTIFNCDVTMSLRFFTGYYVGGLYDSTLGNGGSVTGGSVAQTLGAFPNPGTSWTQGLFSNRYLVGLRISVP